MYFLKLSLSKILSTQLAGKDTAAEVPLGQVAFSPVWAGGEREQVWTGGPVRGSPTVRVTTSYGPATVPNSSSALRHLSSLGNPVRPFTNEETETQKIKYVGQTYRPGIQADFYTGFRIPALEFSAAFLVCVSAIGHGVSARDTS